MRIFALGAISVLLLIAPVAMACEVDGDCSAGSRCVRTFGELYGACERGLPPVEGDDRRIRKNDASSPKRKLGQACEFGSDCDAGLRCVAQASTGRRTCSY